MGFTDELLKFGRMYRMFGGVLSSTLAAPLPLCSGVIFSLGREMSSKSHKKNSEADQSAAPTEEHHGGNGTRLAQEDTSDTFLSPCNGSHPAGPGPGTTENHVQEPSPSRSTSEPSFSVA